MFASSLFFVAFAINHQKWRYSYGRSCFERTLRLASIDLPSRLDGHGEPVVDEAAMQAIVSQSSFWDAVAPHVRGR